MHEVTYSDLGEIKKLSKRIAQAIPEKLMNELPSASISRVVSHACARNLRVIGEVIDDTVDNNKKVFRCLREIDELLEEMMAIGQLHKTSVHGDLALFQNLIHLMQARVHTNGEARHWRGSSTS